MLEEADEQPACQELLEQLVGAVLAPQPDYPRGKGSNMLAYDQFGDLGGTSKRRQGPAVPAESFPALVRVVRHLPRTCRLLSMLIARNRGLRPRGRSPKTPLTEGGPVPQGFAVR